MGGIEKEQLVQPSIDPDVLSPSIHGPVSACVMLSECRMGSIAISSQAYWLGRYVAGPNQLKICRAF